MGDGKAKWIMRFQNPRMESMMGEMDNYILIIDNMVKQLNMKLSIVIIH